MNKIHLTAHAIDRASIRLWGHWKLYRQGDEEGLHAWMCRAAIDALESGKKLVDGSRAHLGIKWVYDFSGECPKLVTVVINPIIIGGKK